MGSVPQCVTQCWLNKEQTRHDGITEDAVASDSDPVGGVTMSVELQGESCPPPTPQTHCCPSAYHILAHIDQPVKAEPGPVS